jgi:hypothetical protein
MKKCVLFLISLLTVSSLANAATNIDIDQIPESEVMTEEVKDYLRILDEALYGNPYGKDVMANTAARLDEKPGDRDLAKIVVIVNRAPKGTAIDAQRARVYIDGRLEKTFIVSTGRIGKESRTGYFRPVYTNHLRFYHEYYSGKYGSRMARAIFYSGGYAIHHTDAVKKLGTRASAGCVRFKLEDIDWINSQAKELLGKQNYVMRKWSHSHHPSWKKNIHYKGLAQTDVHPINRYTGDINYHKKTTSLDMVIIVKDQRDSDRN